MARTLTPAERKGMRSAAKKLMLEAGTATPFVTEPKAYVDTMVAESDRGVMVLAPTLIEDALRHAIGLRMPGLAEVADEQGRVRIDDKRIFGDRGPGATFEAKITLAQALGLISPAASDLINLVRHLRNSAAHGQGEISFASPEFSAAVRALVSQATLEMMDRMAEDGVCGERDAFILLCVNLMRVVLHPTTAEEMPDAGIDEDIRFIDEHHCVPVVESIGR